MWAEILNVVQVFTPAHAVTVFVTVVTVVFSGQHKQKMALKPKPENTWHLGFPGFFGYYPHWTRRYQYCYVYVPAHYAPVCPAYALAGLDVARMHSP